MLQPPPLNLQVIYFDESDLEGAQKLGRDLYNHVTRPVDDQLGFGAGIPVGVGVRHDLVKLDSAEIMVLLPVLGQLSFQDPDIQAQVVARLREWHEKLGPGRVLPIPIAPLWRDIEGTLPGKLLLTELYGDNRRNRTLDEIVLAAARLLDSRTGGVRPFVSHAKLDLGPTDDAATSISNYVATNTTAKSFFDTKDLYAGASLEGQLDAALGAGVLIVVRGDAYNSRVWCQRELLRAKRNKLPTLTVEILRKGEPRSSPYGGNGPCMVWSGDAAAVASRAMVEWLRTAYFNKEAERIKAAADLPKGMPTAARPPELLDLAQGPLAETFAQLVLHPDPELPVIEREILKAARPRLQLVTPTTAFRRLLGRGKQAADVSSPLDGKLIGMSLSETPDADGPEGFSTEHAVDATVYIARSLISAGASIAYAGDFQAHTVDYTRLLVRLIQAYKQTASKEPEYLHSFLARPVNPKSAPPDLPLRFHRVPDPTPGQSHPPALYFSDMRRYMEKNTHARVILGGKKEPKRAPDDQKGYGGRYPGLLEEAWRSLKESHPLYVLGGFGGSAAWVADLFEGTETPPELRDETWMKVEHFRELAAQIEADEDFRKSLGLPGSMEELAAEVRNLAAPLMQSDEASIARNGLTVGENKLLFRSRDPVTLGSLVSKGLLAVARAATKDKLKIELVHGSITTASNLDLIAIATVANVPLAGAGAELDRAVGGRISAERDRRSVIGVRDAKIDADWLFLASLGEVDEHTDLPARVRQAARDAADRAQGFDRIGVVTFGGSMRADQEPLAKAMVEGFRGLPEQATLVWFELNEDRFDKLQESLAKIGDVVVTTHRAAVPPPDLPVRKDPLILQVRLEKGDLCATTLLPSGSAVASMNQRILTDEQVAKFSKGAYGSRRTPNQTVLEANGAELARTLFGDEVAEVLEKCRKSSLIVIHDAQASKFPFEMLAAAGVTPALESGMTRRLLARGLRVESQFAKPARKGVLEVLLIVDPTRNLEGAAQEGARVKAILAPHAGRIKVTELPGEEATVEKVSAALAKADVLHYCGHAFFDGPEPDRSGLILADRELTAADLAKIPQLPAMAFVNACEAARVRGEVPNTEAAAFAEMFLRSGVDAYVGTYWQVGDSAAASFAEHVYSNLADGKTLEAAVLAARNVLRKDEEPDWANYILFGGGDFKLVAG
jgi:hypothetical protein